MYQPTTPCPKCGAQNLQGTWVCAKCGTTLLVYCPNCHAANIAGSKFCQFCGKPVAGMPQSPGQFPPAAQTQPYYQQPPQGYQQQAYGQYDYQQNPGGYPPAEYPPAAGGDAISKVQTFFDTFPARVKQIVSTTNPILLSAMVVLVVGMAVFLLLAFQLGWIKTGSTVTKTTATKDTTPLSITYKTAEEGANKGIIIKWVTNKPSSSQVQYGIYPQYTTITAIQSDPRTGTNAGVLMHEVGLTGLIANSTYVYRCISIDKDDNKATVEDQFSTVSR
jgi:hypothetical protein